MVSQPEKSALGSERPVAAANGGGIGVGRRALGIIRRHWPCFIYALLSAALLWWVSWETFRVRIITYSPNADYWEHSGVLRALLDNPWHPKNPHLVSPASSPRFGPQFVLIALAGRALGLDALGAMSLAAVFNTVLLLLGIYTFFTTYFRDRIAPLYGIVVVFASWWRAWPFSNVYQLNVLVRVDSYPSTTAIGLTLLAFALTLRVLRANGSARGGLALLVLAAGCVFIVHQLTAVLTISGMLLLAFAEPASFRRRAEIVAAVLVGCVLAKFWPYFSPWEVLGGGKSDDAHWVAQGLSDAMQGKVVEQTHRFYHWGELLNALGLSVLGVLALPYFLLRRRRLFVGLGVLSMLVPFAFNYFIEIPLGHRFVLLAFFYLQLAVVWLLLVLTPGSSEASPLLDRPWRRWLGRGLVALVLTPFAVHNLTLAQSESEADRRIARRESAYVRYARAAAEAAGKNAVILADTVNSWPVPSFGPKVLVLRHPNPLVPDEAEREQAVHRFMSASMPLDERLQMLTRYRVTHVLLKGAPRGSLARFLDEHATHIALPAGYSLYALNPATSP